MSHGEQLMAYGESGARLRHRASGAREAAGEQARERYSADASETNSDQRPGANPASHIDRTQDALARGGE